MINLYDNIYHYGMIINILFNYSKIRNKPLFNILLNVKCQNQIKILRKKF